jgi:hypothetical protein
MWLASRTFFGVKTYHSCHFICSLFSQIIFTWTRSGVDFVPPPVHLVFELID